MLLFCEKEANGRRELNLFSIELIEFISSCILVLSHNAGAVQGSARSLTVGIVGRAT